MIFNRIENITEDELLFVASILIVCTTALVAMTLSMKRKDHYLYPPCAPAGIIETVKSISGNDCPWFYVRTAKMLDSNIFRISLPLPGTPMVVVVGDAGVARDILSDRTTEKPEGIYKTFRDVAGGGKSMFTTNGDFWHQRRKNLSPAFSSKHIKRMNNVAIKMAEVWIKDRLEPMIDKGQSFDVAKEMTKITLNAISETAFEYIMTEEEKSMFLSDLELTLKEFLFKTSTNPLRSIFGLLIPERRRAFVAAESLVCLAKKIMSSYKNLKAPQKDTIIDRIMKSDVYNNDLERVGDIIATLLGGFDTTGYSIAWILLELARNPSELVRFQETLSASPSEEWSGSDTLRKIVKEGLRLHPVASGGSVRVIRKDFWVTAKNKKDMLLPKNSIVFIPLIMQLRNADVFEDADKFKPSRWEDPSQEAVNSFIPFSFGKQNCLGQSLANSEINSIVPLLCSKYTFEVVEEGRADYFLTLKPAGARLIARRVVVDAE